VPRALESLLAAAGLVVLAPVLLVIALVIKLDSRGPVLHRALRVGLGGREFELYKFRSMVSDAARYGPGITVRDDPRVTRVGRVLRRTKLDELPQLINVVKGDMSLVGPRPEDGRYVALYTAEQRRVLSVRPGITSPASIRFRREEELLGGDDFEDLYLTQVLPAKLAIELDYLQRRSLRGDVRVVMETLAALLGSGSEDPPARG